MAKFTGHKYTWAKPFTSVRHNWELRSARGGLHFHVSITEGYGDSCGLEFHSVAPLHSKSDAPSHITCEITGGRCWHDGTSLYASEHVWPFVKVYLRTGEHEKIFEYLEREHDAFFDRHFGTSE